MHTFSFPKAILFDWDNTLIDSWNLIHKAMAHILTMRSIESWTLTEVKERCQRSSRDAFPILFPNDYEQAIKDFYIYVHQEHLNHLDFLPKAMETLDYLKNQKIPMGLVSNKAKNTLLKEIEYLNLSGYFQTIVGSGDSERDKPHPESIQFALKCMGIQPSADVWYVGDAATDWQAAEAAGLRSVRLVENSASISNETQSYQYEPLTFTAIADFFHFMLGDVLQKTA